MRVDTQSINHALTQIQTATLTPLRAERALSCMDLTNLNTQASANDIQTLCQQANNYFMPTASVCIYPNHLLLAKTCLNGTAIHLATVANFSEGDMDFNTVFSDISHALESGADEIDVVFPYKRYLAGEEVACRTFIQACKNLLGTKRVLKIILETGVINDSSTLYTMSLVALESGADFIKTSTGKKSIGATLEAAYVMLSAIKAHGHGGFKASGGVRTGEQAAQYLQLADDIMGTDWTQKKHFRLGASALITVLLSAMSG